MSMNASSSGNQWTMEEKVSVLLGMIGKIDWEKVTIPEGRTKKSVMHMIAGLRKASSTKAGTGNTTGTAAGHDGGGGVATASTNDNNAPHGGRRGGVSAKKAALKRKRPVKKEDTETEEDEEIVKMVKLEVEAASEDADSETE